MQARGPGAPFQVLALLLFLSMGLLAGVASQCKAPAALWSGHSETEIALDEAFGGAPGEAG